MAITIDADDIPAIIEHLEGQAAEESGGREPLSVTLADLAETWFEKRFSYWGGSIDNVTVDLDTEPEDGAEREQFIHLGDHQVPATDRGLEAVARIVGVPVRYLLAVPPDEQQFILTRRLERSGELFVSAEFTSEGVQTVRKSGKTILEVGAILEKAIETVGEDAWVRDAWFDHRSLRIDALKPEAKDGVLVGVRYSQDRKQNLAPKVQPYLYVVEGALGIEVAADGIRVDARGKDEMEVLDEMRFQADRALEHATHNRKAYLGLASKKADKDRTAHLRRIALDAGLSNRAVDKISDRIAAVVGERDANMQDFVHLIAGQANYAPESAMARTVQQAAGSLVDDHSERCPTCHHLVV